mgnify:CR=1 FL=1
MFRYLALLGLIGALAAPAAAQAPEGLKVRVDRSTNASDPDDTPELKVMTMGKGFHVVGGPAGTFWDPKNMAKGNYTVKATFNLQQPSNHTNYYGLVFGGSDLEGANQSYSYFIVAQNGQYQVRTRMAEYRAKTAPILPLYEARGLVRHVDGMAPIPEVAARIDAILEGE